MKIFCKSYKRVGGWERYFLTRKVIVLYWLFWEYFYWSVATEVRRERVAIEPDSRFHLLICDSIVSYSGNHTGFFF